MPATRIVTVACLVLALASGTGKADTTLPLYVAADGRDEGLCQQATAPCRSIGYALRHAGKGTEILVATGRYSVRDSEDLYLLLSGDIDVRGGYRRDAGYAHAGGTSTLTGVPQAYRQALRARGFHVIADQKGETVDEARMEQLLATRRKLSAGVAGAPCQNGSTGGLDCDSVDLVAHIPFSSVSGTPNRGTDVWGFVDLNTNREYVIAAFDNGTAVFDVSAPDDPREVAFISGLVAGWRDVKVHQYFDAAAGRWHAWAYVTTDGTPNGLIVIDLGALPQRVHRRGYPGEFNEAHNVYASATDFSTGLPLGDNPRLIIAGSDLGAGQYRAYSLDDPMLPASIAGSGVPGVFPDGNSGYMHDAVSMQVSDSRKDSQCVNADTHCEVLFDFNEENLEVWDISDIRDPVRLNDDRQPYPQAGYVHSGWWTEDRNYLFVHDELDERESGLNSTVRVFSLADLRNPVLAGTWTGPTPAIDHNGFVRGNRYYMSNYSRGLTILDISNPAQPVTTGRLDTYPASDLSGFIGAWGVYPFLPSGIIAISDINSGVYLARDRTRDVPAGLLAFASPYATLAEGAATTIDVTRSGGSTGNVSVDVEMVAATAEAGDIQLGNTTLAWSDGDSMPRSLDVTAPADGDAEDLELLMLRLVNPGGGATLADTNTSHVTIADAGMAATISFLDTDVVAAEQGLGKAVIVLKRQGSASGGASIDYALGGGSATRDVDFSGPLSGTVSWDDGDAGPKWIEYTLVDDGNTEGDETFDVVLSNPVGAGLTGPAAATVTIVDGRGRNLAPEARVATAPAISESARGLLDGLRSSDPDGEILTYAWQQTSGPTVSLTAANAGTTSFAAPAVSSDTVLGFRLTVTDPRGLAGSSDVSITVLDDTGSNQGGGGGGGATLLALVLLLTQWRRYSKG